MPEFKIGDIVYFHRDFAVKAYVEEIIYHYTKEQTIVKYILRPFGLKDYVTIDANDLYSNMTEAQDHAVEVFTKTYNKANILKNYKEAKKQMQDKFENNIKDFEKNAVKAVENIRTKTDDYYDQLENDYQTKVKGEKDVTVK